MNATESGWRLTFAEEKLGDMEGDLIVIETATSDEDGARGDALRKALYYLTLTRRELRKAVKASPDSALEATLRLSIASEREKRSTSPIVKFPGA